MTVVADRMYTEPCVVLQDDSLQSAAMLMAENGIGSLPVVAADGRLLGVLSDRDIVVRAVAEGWEASAQVRLAMTSAAHVCRPWDGIESVVARMTATGIHRLPVVDDAGSVVGVVTRDMLVDGMCRVSAGDVPRTDHHDTRLSV